MNYEEVQQLKQKLKRDSVKYYKLSIEVPDVCDPNVLYLCFNKDGIHAMYQDVNITVDHHEMLQLVSVTGKPVKEKNGKDKDPVG